MTSNPHSPRAFYTYCVESDPTQAIEVLESIPLASRLPFVSYVNREGEERYRGQIPLHAAVRAGHVQLVQLLLDSAARKRPASVEAAHRSTCLVMSASHGSPRC